MRKRPFFTKHAVSIFIVVIMVTSVLGFVMTMSNETSTDRSYKGIDFLADGNSWRFNHEGKSYEVEYLPEEIQHIKISLGIKDMLDKSVLYTTSDLNGKYKEQAALAQYQIQSNLGNIGMYSLTGATHENSYNIPVITCENATSSMPVIFFKEGNSTEVYSQGNCIIAQASYDQDLVRIADRIIYEKLGII